MGKLVIVCFKMRLGRGNYQVYLSLYNHVGRKTPFKKSMGPTVDGSLY